MESKKLERVFDRVRLSREREDAILADLTKKHNEEVSNMKQTARRRVPAAALAAAVLAIVLAGTAVAAYLSRLTVTPYEGGYKVRTEAKNIPQESLPADLRERAAALGGKSTHLPFGSWDEAEAYLGREIADNARLDQMTKGECGGIASGDTEAVSAPCVILLSAHKGLPDIIEVHASFRENLCHFSVEAVLIAKNPLLDGDKAIGFTNTLADLTGTETYVTPGGLETTIVTSQEDVFGMVYTNYEAQFILNDATFRVGTSVNERQASGEEALALLKEVLDAYE